MYKKVISLKILRWQSNSHVFSSNFSSISSKIAPEFTVFFGSTILFLGTFITFNSTKFNAETVELSISFNHFIAITLDDQSFNHALRNNEEIPLVTDDCSSFTRSIILFFLLPRNRSVPDDGGHQTSTSFPAKIDGFDGLWLIGGSRRVDLSR
ncbi:hypothetical protein HanXRQr2_Chr12g0549731 [Helianthus annuus]|nr:hypothetical protein HanXRQr2_Chr12g0549731 [Helianthus annuus]KAJ0678865.1 hypothetical protein HanOQP8_Chr12g0452731 [Helianthus annuus]KAJ0863379.1 hypothetical protein HanPSC8_Chr12g0529301 [Helianthus annuus]